jgi:hypothetical protein
MSEHDSGVEREGDGAGETMRARRWAIAVRFILPAITSWNISTPRGVENLHVIIAGSIKGPADYDIPKLPDWREGCDSEGRLCLSAGHSREPFISAENPVPVRR